MRSPLLCRTIELTASTPLQSQPPPSLNPQSTERTVVQNVTTELSQTVQSENNTVTGASPIIAVDTVKKVNTTIKIVENSAADRTYTPDSLEIPDGKRKTRSTRRSTRSEAKESTKVEDIEMKEPNELVEEAGGKELSSPATAATTDEIEVLPQAETEDVIDNDEQLDISAENVAPVSAEPLACGKSFVDTTTVSMAVDETVGEESGESSMDTEEHPGK